MRLAAVLLLVLSAAGSAKTVEIRIVHTNDIHGWIMPRPDKKAKGRLIGGAAALASVVKAERRKGPTLVLDAGDWFQGTPEGNLPRGAALAEIFNAIGHDAVVIGNHEFDFGQEVLEELVGKISVPVLGANILRVSTGKTVEYAGRYIVKEAAGVKVGIFGMVTCDVPDKVFPNSVAGLDFRKEIETARETVAEMRSKGVEIVIGLTHVGQESDDSPPFIGDRAVAAAVPGIDIIVGGHTHAAIENPVPEPSGTLIVNAGAYLKTVGVATLEFDDEKRVVSASRGEVRKLWIDEVGEDPEIKRIVERYRREVGRELDIVIGRAEDDLPEDRTRLSPAGAWLTDCVRKYTKTDVAFQNAGGIRTGLESGPVRIRSLFEMMPFDNYLMTLYMNGASVKKVLEHGVSFAPHVVQASGIEYTWDAELPRGARLIEASIRGRDIRDDEVYSVTAPDFIVRGGDGYEAFAEGTDAVTTRNLVRDVLAWCARGYSPIRAPDLSRVTRR
jgi:2',3'-cyclic-nucleotide 2'-phosphodiesterase (5'-nucleotidase family)